MQKVGIFIVKSMLLTRMDGGFGESRMCIDLEGWRI